MRKWSSNSEEVLTKIVEFNNNDNNDNLVLFQNGEHLKTLGIVWDSKQDLLRYSINVTSSSNKVTKRTILSTISQIFDPLGLVGPALIRAKIIIQSLWKLQLSWDEEVPNVLKQLWIEFSNQISCLNKVQIERLAIIPESKHIELYGFSDSSEKAYGACIYLCPVDTLGKREIRLLTAKSKVAPAKKLTLPRLEYLAVFLLAKLMHKVLQTIDIKHANVKYLTDSTIVLSWFRIDSAKLVVANRVSKITEISELNDWAHVSSKNNPADVIFRGLSPKELLGCNLWFRGPDFLQHFEYHNHSCNSSDDVNQLFTLENVLEFKPDVTIINNAVEIKIDLPDLDIFDKFSTLHKLLRIVAYICRFKNRGLKKIQPKCNTLTIEKLDESFVSKMRFYNETVHLQRRNKILNNSRILNLNSFLDSNGILRVGGRVTNSNYSFDQSHSIILPNKHKFTDLLIMSEHIKHLHVGIQNLLTIIRLGF